MCSDYAQIVINFFLAGFSALPVLVFALVGKPHENGFFCGDESINRPYHSDTVPTSTLYAVGFTAPFLVIFLVEGWIYYRNKSKDRVASSNDEDENDPGDNCCLPPLLEDVIRISLGYLVGAALTPSFTDIIKYTTGRLRPHFLDVCQPNWSEIDCSPEDHSGGLFSRYIEADEYRCLGNEVTFPDEHERESALKDARLSFPSGHASFSFQTSVFIVIYLQARIIALSRRRRSRADVAVVMLQAVAMFYPVYTSITRITDGKHFPGDVLAGAAIGTVVQTLNCLYSMKLFSTPAMKPYTTAVTPKYPIERA